MRRDKEVRGQIELSPEVVKEFIKKHPRFKFLTEDYQFRNSSEPVYLPVRKIQLAEL